MVVVFRFLRVGTGGGRGLASRLIDGILQTVVSLETFSGFILHDIFLFDLHRSAREKEERERKKTERQQEKMEEGRKEERREGGRNGGREGGRGRSIQT